MPRPPLCQEGASGQKFRYRTTGRSSKVTGCGAWPRPPKGRGERIAEFRKAWRSARKAAGLPGLLVHDLRRSAVRNMERAGVPRSVATKITGHKTESVYRRYAIVAESDLHEAGAKLAAVTMNGDSFGVRR